MLRTSKFTPDFVYLDDRDPDECEGYTPKELTSDPLDVGTGDALKAALQRLAPMYREAFLLREFEGYSYEEISEMTGASVMMKMGPSDWNHPAGVTKSPGPRLRSV